ncbi:hypothetical protein R1sor_012850 [Riccia sorocarpa]|uniref:Uncharacterized protein n=1 Tax=Riccia sorocarpa TaxID=122646 RepID=A0ABD3I8B1_9MARC
MKRRRPRWGQPGEKTECSSREAMATRAQGAEGTISNLSHTTNTRITYDQIFKEKAAGKVLLTTRYPLERKYLHAGHAQIRAWFRHYETDALQFDLLHENYRLNPDMKHKLNLFVSERISQLPPLVLVPGGDTGTLSFEWKHETVYLHIIAHRQEFKKALKRRPSLSTADAEDIDLDDPRVLVKSANTYSRNVSGRDEDHLPAHPLSTRTSNLSEDEPDMMSIIMKGGKFGLYALKDKPTIQHLQMRDCGTTPDIAVESVDFIGFDLSQGCLIDYAQCYVTVMEEDDVFARLMKMEWTAKPSNTAGAAEVGPKNKNKEPEELMNTTSLDKECESNHFAKNSNKGQTTLQAYKRRVLAPKNADNLGEDNTPAPRDSYEVCEIVAMVVVGCNKKDDLPIGLTKYMTDLYGF